MPKVPSNTPTAELSGRGQSNIYLLVPPNTPLNILESSDLKLILIINNPNAKAKTNPAFINATSVIIISPFEIKKLCL
jgi:hypothetical protein